MNSKNLSSQRQIRFGEIIRAIISKELSKNYILSEKIELSSVTVSFVKISKDLKIASVYIMPLGGYKKEEILKLLNESKHIFQKSIANEKLNSKFTPIIRFFLDDTFEEAERIKKLLLNKRVLRDLK